jgi:glycosyltransferase involved in cell wall biosynthesis
MRIVFLCTSSLDYPSPRGRWLPVARELARAGHFPDLLMLHPTLDRAGQASGMCDGVAWRYVAQMHVYGLPGQRRALGPAELLLVSLRAAAALARQAVQARPDVLVIAKPQPINGLAALLAQRVTGCRLHLDCDDYEAGANRFSSAWQRRMVAWWEDALPARAWATTANTRVLFERCRALGANPERLRYVPNGISAEQMRPLAPGRREALRAALGLEDRPTLIYLGALSSVAHGVSLLLEAFERVLARLPQARLLIVGQGDDRLALEQEALARGIGPAVLWAGWVPARAAPAYLALADASADPVFDTVAMAARSPLKVVESMAQGIPVVTGDVGDRREMLGQAGGVLVRPGDAVALADGIVALLGDPDLARRMSAGARERAAAYRWERLARPWVALYDNL